MAKWGLITDTHGKKYLVEKAINLFKSEHCSSVFHSGDFETGDYETDEIYDLFQNHNFDFYYVTDHKSHDRLMKNRNDFFAETIDGFYVGMMHDTYEEKTIKNIKMKVEDFISHDIFDFFFYGHLHYLNFKLPAENTKTIAINSGGLYFKEYYDSNSLYTVCILDPQKKIMEVYYYYDYIKNFINLLRINFDKPMEKCMMYYKGGHFNRFIKLMKEHMSYTMDRYSFSYIPRVGWETDHLWFNKNLDILDNLNK